MRRMLLVLLAVAVLAAPFAAFAQTFSVPGNPTVLWSNASITDVNSASEVSMFQYVVPAALIATSTNVTGTVTGTNYLSNANSQAWQMNAPQPLHFRAIGTVGGGQVSTLMLGVNLGGSTATVNLNNITTGGLGAGLQPARLDVYVIPIATTTATPTSTNNSVFLVARFEYGGMTAAGGTATVVTSNTIAALNVASPAQLNVVSRWQSAVSSSTLNFNNRILRIGE